MNWLRNLLRRPPSQDHPPEVLKVMKDRDVAIAAATAAVHEVDRVNLLMDEYEEAERLRKRRGR